MPSLSRSLETALHHAIKLASDRHHEYATLEHLLLALMDDADAGQVMKACNVDTDALRKEVQKYVDGELITLVIEDGEEAKPTTGFQRVVQRAVLHVQNSGRDDLVGRAIPTREDDLPRPVILFQWCIAAGADSAGRGP